MRRVRAQLDFTPDIFSEIHDPYSARSHLHTWLFMWFRPQSCFFGWNARLAVISFMLVGVFVQHTLDDCISRSKFAILCRNLLIADYRTVF
jgi:hypothetical protein